MAGKSHKGRNRRGSHGSTGTAVATHAQPPGAATTVKENASTPELSVVDANGAETKPETKESENYDPTGSLKEGTD